MHKLTHKSKFINNCIKFPFCTKPTINYAGKLKNCRKINLLDKSWKARVTNLVSHFRLERSELQHNETQL